MITVFQDVHSIAPHHTSLEAVFNAIENGKYSAQISRIRSEPDKEERNYLKRKLPIACFSGKFSVRKDDALIEHSGLICLDFDHVNDVASLKASLQLDPYCYAAFVSPSGDGVKMIVRIPKNNHRGSFRALRKRYTQIDNTPDESRACFLSWDSEIWINNAASVFKTQIDDDVKKVSTVANGTQEKDQNKLFKAILNGMQESGIHYHDGRNIFFFKLFCDCNEFGIEKAISMPMALDLITDDFSFDELKIVAENAYKRQEKFGTKFLRAGSESIYEDSDVDKPIDWTIKLPPANYYVKIGDVGIAEEGSIVTITGKAKSMKTTLLKGIAASAISGRPRLNISVNTRGRDILWIDTEQSIRDMYTLGGHIEGLCQTRLEDQVLVKFFALRTADSAKQRLERTKKILDHYDAGIVIVDGAVDLLDSYNDEEQSKSVVSYLLKVADERKMCVFPVIHLAKTTGYARGHMGTELINKSQNVILVEKDPNEDGWATVSSSETRGAPFNEFQIGFITSDGKTYPVTRDHLQTFII